MGLINRQMAPLDYLKKLSPLAPMMTFKSAITGGISLALMLGLLLPAQAATSTIINAPESPVPMAALGLYEPLPNLAKPVAEVAAATPRDTSVRKVRFRANSTQLVIPTTRPLGLKDARKLSTQKLTHPNRLVVTLPDAVFGRKNQDLKIGKNGIRAIKIRQDRGILYGVSEVTIVVDKPSTLERLSTSVTNDGFVVALKELPRPFHAGHHHASPLAQAMRVPGATGKNIVHDVFFRDSKLQVNGISSSQLEVANRFTLTEPSRLVIDLHDTALADKSLATTIMAPHPDIRQIRVGQFDEDTVRLVIETPHPERWGPELQDTPSNELAVGHGWFTESGRIQTGRWTPVSDKANQVVEIITRKSPTPEAKKNTTQTISNGTKQSLFPATVVIDPGHGGKDKGAMRNGYYEKNLNLAVAFKLRDALRKRGIKVHMTRESDIFLPLPKIVQIANRIHPDLFISVHTNASTNPKIKGLETYYYTYKSKALANVVHKELAQDLNTPDRGVRRAMFYVIHHTKIPAILCEIGYISNSTERADLFSRARQNTSANAMADGLVGYLNKTLSARAKKPR